MRLDIEDVRHSYGKLDILTDVFLGCSSGEVVALLGLNGSGKTTLFRIVTGLLTPKSAIVRIDNSQVRIGTIPRYVAYMAQESFLPIDMNVKTCIRIFCDTPDAERTVLADERIGDLLHARIGTLSPGEKRYLELRLILVKDRDFVILDEPFSELDPICTENAIALIRDASRKKGIILTDQDYRSVLSVSTSISLLAHGAVEHIDSKKDLIERGYLFDE